MDNTESRLVALVPMRHVSVRVPGKNYRLVAGKPLYSYIIDTLRLVPEVDRIVVDTDSAIIQEGIIENYPEVRILQRPDHLTGENIPINQVLLHDLSMEHAAYYLQTHSTNPLIKPTTLSNAIEQFLSNLADHDALFGVTRRHVRIWDKDVKPLNHDPYQLENTQNLAPFFEENSCVYLFTREAMLQTENRLGKRPSMFEISQQEAFDIDTEADFDIVRILLEAGVSNRM